MSPHVSAGARVSHDTHCAQRSYGGDGSATLGQKSSRVALLTTHSVRDAG
jgi:hypothetical protein